MLKIKDEIDLRELERFGFYKRLNRLNGQYHCKDFTICKNRTIAVHNGGSYKRNDVLYDLIQAGFVEKVGD